MLPEWHPSASSQPLRTLKARTGEAHLFGRFCDVLRKVRLGWRHFLGLSVGQIKAARRSLLWDHVKPACFPAEAFAFEQRAAAQATCQVRT